MRTILQITSKTNIDLYIYLNLASSSWTIVENCCTLNRRGHSFILYMAIKAFSILVATKSQNDKPTIPFSNLRWRALLIREARQVMVSNLDRVKQCGKGNHRVETPMPLTWTDSYQLCGFSFLKQVHQPFVQYEEETVAHDSSPYTSTCLFLGEHYHTWGKSNFH